MDEPEVRPGARSLRLHLLPEPLALVRLGGTEPIPSWVAGAEQFCSVTRTADELSIVADESVVPDGLPAERPYRALRIEGPLPLHWVGILAAVAATLASARIPIFTIATYDTDYVLVKAADLPRAETALREAGHTIMPLASGR